MKRTCVMLMVVMIAAVILAAARAPRAGAADAPLLEVVLEKARAAAGEYVAVGIKGARPGVVITSATMRPREAQQFVMPLNDSGLLGDTANDGVWSVRFPVPDSVPPGFYSLDFEAQVKVDGQAQTAAATAQVEVLAGGSASVEVIAPAEGAVLSGPVEVTAKLMTLVPTARVEVYLGAASAEMRSEGDVWRATLDTLGADNGRQRLVVAAAAAGTSADADRQQAGALAILSALNWHAEVPVTVRNPYQCYWGDIHAHTLYSDGVETPADAYRHARDAAKIDFFSVTDHDDTLTFDEYADIRRQADAFDQPGAFAALYGVEWTTDAGHMCFYLADRFRLAKDLESAYRELGEMGLTAHFNHPDLENFNHARYSPAGAGALCGAEVREAKEEAAYVAMLDAGWRVGADGSQDKHDATWGDGPHWTVALARNLSRQDIIGAIRARRTYSTFDRNMRLDFTLDGEDMGADVSRPAGELPCVVSLSDPDPGDNIARIEAIVDGQTAASVAPGVTEYTWNMTIPLAPGRHYAYLRVTQADGNQAWSSPIWVRAY